MACNIWGVTLILTRSSLQHLQDDKPGISISSKCQRISNSWAVAAISSLVSQLSFCCMINFVYFWKELFEWQSPKWVAAVRFLLKWLVSMNCLTKRQFVNSLKSPPLYCHEYLRHTDPSDASAVYSCKYFSSIIFSVREGHKMFKEKLVRLHQCCDWEKTREPIFIKELKFNAAL